MDFLDTFRIYERVCMYLVDAQTRVRQIYHIAPKKQRFNPTPRPAANAAAPLENRVADDVAGGPASVLRSEKSVEDVSADLVDDEIDDDELVVSEDLGVYVGPIAHEIDFLG